VRSTPERVNIDTVREVIPRCIVAIVLNCIIRPPQRISTDDSRQGGATRLPGQVEPPGCNRGGQERPLGLPSPDLRGASWFRRCNLLSRSAGRSLMDVITVSRTEI
jgi:hypothetical protein